MRLAICALGAACLSLILFSCSRKSSSPEYSVAQQKLAPTQAPLLAVKDLCENLKKEVRGLKWKLEPCQGIEWKVGGTSIQGAPLVYAEFGDSKAKNATLVFSGVHGDEITPLFLGLQLAHWMKAHTESVSNLRVIVAPLVNPDGFFRRPRTRMNAKGVDVNRNFPTKDWNIQALEAWKTQFKSDPRRYPGPTPRSEPETVFQEDLIRKFRPQKILSIHAPLNVFDYDGPTVLSLAKFPKEYVNECLKLRRQLRAVPTGFFPGSLGNYAGQEMGIPTLTLELPSADPKMAQRYWDRFQSGIRSMIEFAVPEHVSNSLFLSQN